MCTHTIKVGEIAQGVPPKGAKTCFAFILTQPTRPFGHLPALISTIVETKYMIQCPHVYTGEKFLNFCTAGF